MYFLNSNYSYIKLFKYIALMKHTIFLNWDSVRILSFSTLHLSVQRSCPFSPPAPHNLTDLNSEITATYQWFTNVSALKNIVDLWIVLENISGDLVIQYINIAIFTILFQFRLFKRSESYPACNNTALH